MTTSPPTPNLEDLINEWRKDTAFADWSYTKSVGHPQFTQPSGYLYPPESDKRGVIQVWNDHVIVIIAPTLIDVFRASHYYINFIEKLTPPGSNQYIRINSADPEFFEMLGDFMGKIKNDDNNSGG